MTDVGEPLSYVEAHRLLIAETSAGDALVMQSEDGLTLGILLSPAMVTALAALLETLRAEAGTWPRPMHVRVH